MGRTAFFEENSTKSRTANHCRIIARMSEKDESGCSRRTFVKSVSATAVTLMSGIGNARPMQADGMAPASDATWLSLSEASRLVRDKKVSPVELTKSCLNRIERLNPKLNAFITVTAESALAQAREAETEIQRGHWRGPLHGVPIALKDLFDTAGIRTTGASALFKERIPTQDGEVVRRLKGAGAVLLGKLNMHEFAYGGSSVISYYGPVHNPWSLDHMAGGSSSGSAVAMTRRSLLWRGGFRYWWLHSPAIGVLRDRWIEANVWTREHPGRDSSLLAL